MPLSLIAGYHLELSTLDSADLQDGDVPEEECDGCEPFCCWTEQPATPTQERLSLCEGGETYLPLQDSQNNQKHDHSCCPEGRVASQNESHASPGKDDMWAMLDEQIQAELDAAMDAAASEADVVTEQQVASELDSLVLTNDRRWLPPRSLHSKPKAQEQRATLISKSHRTKSVWPMNARVNSPRCRRPSTTPRYRSFLQASEACTVPC